jgi:hypothetical protein
MTMMLPGSFLVKYNDTVCLHKYSEDHKYNHCITIISICDPKL